MDRCRSAPSQQGAAAVEFALVSGLLVTLVFGLVDFGWMINRDTLLNNATREGAREGSLNPTTTDITNVVHSALPGFTPADVVVTVSCRKPDASPCPNVDADAAPGDAVIVRVDFDHRWITPIGQTFGSSIGLSKTTEMRIE